MNDTITLSLRRHRDTLTQSIERLAGYAEQAECAEQRMTEYNLVRTQKRRARSVLLRKKRRFTDEDSGIKHAEQQQAALAKHEAENLPWLRVEIKQAQLDTARARMVYNRTRAEYVHALAVDNFDTALAAVLKTAQGIALAAAWPARRQVLYDTEAKRPMINANASQADINEVKHFTVNAVGQMLDERLNQAAAELKAEDPARHQIAQPPKRHPLEPSISSGAAGAQIGRLAREVEAERAELVAA